MNNRLWDTSVHTLGTQHSSNYMKEQIVG